MMFRLFFVTLSLGRVFLLEATVPHIINVDDNFSIHTQPRAIEVRKENQIQFSFHSETLEKLTEYFLIRPNEGEHGPFLVTVWATRTTSQVALIFDISQNSSPKDSLVYHYISAHHIRFPHKREEMTDRLTMIGYSNQLHPRSMDSEEMIKCKWHYKTNTQDLACQGP